MLVAAAGYAQESRQDVSVSVMGLFAPQVNGNAVQLNTTSAALGVLASYRYMLTPHSALELNYSLCAELVCFPDKLPAQRAGQYAAAGDQRRVCLQLQELQELQPLPRGRCRRMIFYSDYGTQEPTCLIRSRIRTWAHCSGAAWRTRLAQASISAPSIAALW